MFGPVLSLLKIFFGVVPSLAKKGAAQGDGVGLFDESSFSPALNTLSSLTGVMLLPKGLLSSLFSLIKLVLLFKGLF